jgi:site-specific recombinase XerC
VRSAARWGAAHIDKPVIPQSARSRFATQLSEPAADIRPQDRAGRKEVTTTQISTQVSDRGAGGLLNPLDR